MILGMQPTDAIQNAIRDEAEAEDLGLARGGVYRLAYVAQAALVEDIVDFIDSIQRESRDYGIAGAVQRKFGVGV